MTNLFNMCRPVCVLTMKLTIFLAPVCPSCVCLLIYFYISFINSTVQSPDKPMPWHCVRLCVCKQLLVNVIVLKSSFIIQILSNLNSNLISMRACTLPFLNQPDNPPCPPPSPPPSMYDWACVIVKITG